MTKIPRLFSKGFYAITNFYFEGKGWKNIQSDQIQSHGLGNRQTERTPSHLLKFLVETAKKLPGISQYLFMQMRHELQGYRGEP